MNRTLNTCLGPLRLCAIFLAAVATLFFGRVNVNGGGGCSRMLQHVKGKIIQLFIPKQVLAQV